MTDLNIPKELADLTVADLTADQLSTILEASTGGVRLAFAGKQLARQVARRVRPRTLTTISKYGYGASEEGARNLLIEGDNLQSMVTLYKYRGQVDLILADPPYNTGRDFRYNDRWDEDPNDEGLGDLVDADDGARHTKWLKFMWPRLQLMKAMLKPTGVLAICIDHRELFRLGQMLDELFGEANRIAIINWQKSYAPKSDKTHVSTATEYVLVYAKNPDRATTAALPRTAAANARYKNDDGDLRLWKGGDAMGPGAKTHQGMVYGLQSPFTGEMFYPTSGNCWRSEKKYVKQWLEQWGVKYVERDIKDDEKRSEVIGLPTDQVRKAKALVVDGSATSAAKAARATLKSGPWPRLFFGKEGDGRPQLKNYLEDVKQGFVPMTYWANDDYDEPLELDAVSWAHGQSGHSQSGIDELNAIVGKGHGFETVKPLKLFSKIIQIWAPRDGLVLDPFAGSGTTGHAVQSLNATGSADRRFILIEQGRPESGDPYARTLTKERLRRAFSGDCATGPREPLGGGFTYKRLSGKIDGDAVLRMERADMRDTVVFSHYGEGRRRKDVLCPVEPEKADDYRYLVAWNSDNEGFFLVWEGPDKNTDLTRDVYASIAEEAKQAKLTLGRYHVYARRWIYQRKTTSFYQIPDHILASFGLDVRSEPFADEDLD